MNLCHYKRTLAKILFWAFMVASVAFIFTSGNSEAGKIVDDTQTWRARPVIPGSQDCVTLPVTLTGPAIIEEIYTYHPYRLNYYEGGHGQPILWNIAGRGYVNYIDEPWNWLGRITYKDGIPCKGDKCGNLEGHHVIIHSRGIVPAGYNKSAQIRHCAPFWNDQQFSSTSRVVVILYPGNPQLKPLENPESLPADIRKSVKGKTSGLTPTLTGKWSVGVTGQALSATWVLHENGVIEDPGKWKGSWKKRADGKIDVTITFQGKTDSLYLVLGKDGKEFTAYKNGAPYRYGRRP